MSTRRQVVKPASERQPEPPRGFDRDARALIELHDRGVISRAEVRMNLDALGVVLVDETFPLPPVPPVALARSDEETPQVVSPEWSDDEDEEDDE